MTGADWRFPDRLERALGTGANLLDRPGGSGIDRGMAFGTANIGDHAFAGVVKRNDRAGADEVLKAAFGAVDLKHASIIGDSTPKQKRCFGKYIDKVY